MNETEVELLKQLTDKRDELRRFSFGSTKSGKAINVKAARNLRKEIARIMTKLQML